MHKLQKRCTKINILDSLIGQIFSEVVHFWLSETKSPLRDFTCKVMNGRSRFRWKKHKVQVGMGKRKSGLYWGSGKKELEGKKDGN